MRDLIKDSESGFLIPTGDWEEMANLAILVIEHPEISISISTQERMVL
jgi:glycosyltransferase involved in cell wall biosynthesis